MSFVNPFDTTENVLNYNGVPFSFAFFQHIPNPKTIDNSDLRLLAKAILKRDPKTKLKSLNALISSFESVSQEQGYDYSFLQFFAQVYPKLAINNDKMIRCNSHRLASLIVSTYRKKAAPYLKIIVPIWLLGLFDTEKLVVMETNKSILSCFNSQEKKNNLYIIFQEEILEVIEHFLNNETVDTLVDKSTTSEDEAALTFTRCLSTFINLLSHLVSNDLIISKNEHLIAEILKNNDKLWVYISSNCSDYNYLSVKSSLLTLANSCLMDKTGKYKVLISSIFKHVFKLIKTVPNYKNYYVSLTNLILISMINLKLDLKADNLIKFKKAFIQFLNAYFDSALSNFFSYLSILYERFPEDVFNFTSVQDFEEFVQIPLLKSKLKFSSPIKSQLFEFFNKMFVKFYKKASDKEHMLVCLQKLLLKEEIDPSYLVILLDSLNPEDLNDVLSCNSDKLPLVKFICLLQLLENQHVTSTCFSNLVNDIKNKMNGDSFLENKSGNNTEKDIKCNFYVGMLDLVYVIIDSNLYKFEQSKSIVADFILSSVALYLEAGHFDLVTKILTSLDNSNSDLYRQSLSERVSEVINWATDKEDYISKVDQFLSNFKNISNIQSSAIDSFIQKHVVTADVPILSICFKFLNVQTLAILYSHLTEKATIIQFWSNWLKTSRLKDKWEEFSYQLRTLIPDENFVEIFWKNLPEIKSFEKLSSRGNDEAVISDALSLLESFIVVNDNLFELYFSSLLKYIKEALIEGLDSYDRLLKYFLYKFAVNTKLRELLIPITEEFLLSLESLVDLNSAYSLGLTENSLNSFFYVITEQKKEARFKDAQQFIFFSKFLLDLGNKSESNIGFNDKEYIEFLTNITLVSLFANDYIFYKSGEDNDTLDNNKKMERIETMLLDFKSHAFSILTGEFGQDFSMDTLYFQDNVFDVENSSQSYDFAQYLRYLAQKFDQGINIPSLYFAKLHQALLVTLVNKNENNISTDNSSKIYSLINKNIIKPQNYIKLLTLIPILPYFLKSQHLDNIKRFVLSELLGMKSITQDTLNQGLVILITLNNLLIIEQDITLPKIQSNMLIKVFEQWLSSDISYDVEFLPVRIQFLLFFRLVLQNSTFNESLDFVIESVFQDSLGIASALFSGSSLDDNPKETSFNINLVYSSLKFFSILTEAEYRDTQEEFATILVGMLNDSYISLHPNQSVILTLDIYKRCLINGKLDSSVFNKHYNLLLNSFVSEYTALEIKRLNAYLLDKVRIALQKEFIQEFALNYKSIIANSQQESIFKIPVELLNNIKHAPNEYIEYESFHKTFGYLWTWLEILRFFYDNIPSYLQKVYVTQLPENAVENLLLFIFKQIDIDNDRFIDLKRKESEISKGRKLSDMIDNLQNYDYFSDISSAVNLNEIKIVLLHLYYLLLMKFRFDSQAWFMNIRDKKLKSNIDMLTVKYISAGLIERELNNLQKLVDLADEKTGVHEIHTIKINRSSNEIKSQYMIDEQSTELLFKLPKSYPLQNIVVEAPKRIGVKEITWKSWILACQNMVNTGKALNSGSGGSSQVSTLIFDAIELFDKNINLHFKGFEECAICYAILHLQDKSLPTKSCQTCHNKFHSGCLLKWFKSSGNNTCPLCRSEFNFRLGSN